MYIPSKTVVIVVLSSRVLTILASKSASAWLSCPVKILPSYQVIWLVTIVSRSQTQACARYPTGSRGLGLATRD